MGDLLIPKWLHRIWLGDQPIPPEHQQFAETWLRYHPDWQLQTWTKDNLPPLINTSEFQSENVVTKSDILRYELLLRFGGVYIDTDVECLRNIEPLLADVTAFMGFEDHQYLCTAVMGSIPGHPLFSRLIAELAQHYCDFPFDGEYRSAQTGPMFLTKHVLRFLDGGDGDVVLFAPEVFYPYHWKEPWRRFEDFPNAYAAHHWAKSWLSDEQLRESSGGDAISTSNDKGTIGEPRLIDILARYFTDKNTSHSYGELYETLFAAYRQHAEYVLEIGISTGGSLRAWRDYFARATIVGFDRLSELQFSEPRIMTIQGDQNSIDDLLATRRLPGGSGEILYDIIIDDGCHDIRSQVMSLFYLWPALRPGGIYVIEDIADVSMLTRFNIFAHAITMDRRHLKGKHDDMLVVLQKPS